MRGGGIVTRTLFVLGGTGFIGREVIAEAQASGFVVRALARSPASAAALAAAGAHPVRGDAANPADWAGELRGVDVLIDLVQPPLPTRMGARAVSRIVSARKVGARGVADALHALPPAERPVWFSISGADDLQPDGQGVISDASPLRSELAGFARIGVPIRRLIEGTGLEVTYVYFGVMVYGPGKGFAEHYVEGLRRRRMRVIGDGKNRLPIVHVTDAARALVHLAGLPREELVGRTFVASDGADTTQRELIDQTAQLMGIKAPGHAPARLVGLLAGKAVAEAMTFDAQAENSALRATGFSYRYPTITEGLPHVLAALGALKTDNGTAR